LFFPKATQTNHPNSHYQTKYTQLIAPANIHFLSLTHDPKAQIAGNINFLSLTHHPTTQLLQIRPQPTRASPASQRRSPPRDDAASTRKTRRRWRPRTRRTLKAPTSPNPSTVSSPSLPSPPLPVSHVPPPPIPSPPHRTAPPVPGGGGISGARRRSSPWRGSGSSRPLPFPHWSLPLPTPPIHTHLCLIYCPQQRLDLRGHGGGACRPLPSEALLCCSSPHHAATSFSTTARRRPQISLATSTVRRRARTLPRTGPLPILFSPFLYLRSRTPLHSHVVAAPRPREGGSLGGDSRMRHGATCMAMTSTPMPGSIGT
jgi:hypothetical protein